MLCSFPFSYIEFIAYTIDAFYIVRQIRGNPDFLSQVAYMVVDCLSGIVGVCIACRFLVPRIFALSGGISSNEKRGGLHILLLIIRIFQFDGSVNDTFHNGQIFLRAKL